MTINPNMNTCRCIRIDPEAKRMNLGNEPLSLSDRARDLNGEIRVECDEFKIIELRIERDRLIAIHKTLYGYNPRISLS